MTRERVEPTPRRSMTPKRKAEVFLASKGRCGKCGTKLTGDWEADHIISLFLGGADDLPNLWALCVPCHRRMKTPADAKAHAKVKRLKAKHEGTATPTLRPLRSGRKLEGRGFDKANRKRMDGTVVPREPA